MIEIKTLTQLNEDDLRRLVTGYTANARYCVSKSESDKQLTLTLELVPLPQAYVKRYDHLDPDTLEHYRQMAQLGFSLGAYDNGECVAMVIAEPHQWNKSLWVCEFHVAETHRRRGIGRRVMDVLAQKGQAAGLRTIVCETQNTNAPAIAFYRQAGFRVEGIDLSYYSNDDFPDREIALFMKRRLT